MMRILSSSARAAGVSGRITTPARNAVAQRRWASGGAGHRPSQMRVGGSNQPGVWQFAKNWAWDDPAHQFQDEGRQQIADATSRSDTFYGSLVARTNRALDRTGYSLPKPLVHALTQGVTDESEGKISQPQAHWNEAKGFGRHFFKKGILEGDEEARNMIYPTGMAMNTLGALGTGLAEAWGANPEDERSSYLD
jgi:hypothetical protein